MNHKNIGPEEFDKLSKEPNTEIIDVRTPAEKEEGFIEGAKMINIMGPDFANEINALDKDKTYLVYCRSGNRSGTACGFMASNGFDKLYNLDGGINAWNQYANS
ncbi:rhodanese-like domain-containing protein [Marivirga arenosa]|jgi:rhodanese-related sulfurtransferase|uniref:Rhodanese-like domain-containing protein n=1 Tax=Marivirga arenosa TaxID=3059076 RepID=A0AA49JHB8_9BACT|nr:MULTISPECIES: rhodanese-like domain-containing protein [unclassified Marivirga]WKK79493.1 rhodanese-like domain-containing protein [Marivirga sp. BKB1-2]WMN06199.1 rhodanese-like domain-containing protein [Marivirga sp. ABR2-2]